MLDKKYWLVVLLRPRKSSLPSLSGEVCTRSSSLHLSVCLFHAPKGVSLKCCSGGWSVMTHFQSGWDFSFQLSSSFFSFSSCSFPPLRSLLPPFVLFPKLTKAFIEKFSLFQTENRLQFQDCWRAFSGKLAVFANKNELNEEQKKLAWNVLSNQSVCGSLEKIEQTDSGL